MGNIHRRVERTACRRARLRASAGRTPWWFGWLAVMCAAALAAAAEDRPPPPADGGDYQLGGGRRIESLGLKLGGYLDAGARDLDDQQPRFSATALSLFATWKPGARWLLFTEFEAEDALTIDDRGATASDARVVLERLYADYAITGRLAVRAGKFLTPFGRWNLVHAAPLVWTTSRPLVTNLPLASHASGVAIHGWSHAGANRLEYTAYLDHSEALDPSDDATRFEGLGASGEAQFDYAGGGQLRYFLLNDRAELGVSLTSFRMAGLDEHKHLVGADGHLAWRRFELSSELAYRFSAGDTENDEWGVFVQGVVRVHGPIHAVARYERYRRGIGGSDVSKGVLGFAYRPRPAVTLKFEYDLGNHRRLAPDGWQVSGAVMF